MFDRDDPEWSGEREFAAALEVLGQSRGARAVVIRSGATSSARDRAAALMGATHRFVMLAPRDVLVRRVVRRGREDQLRTTAGVDTWLRRFDRRDGIESFPGWPAVFAGDDLGLTSW
ncbi:hypothetical protein [Serinibacter salmoneus]|uniref:hypothetical protein n=1 Tax=Serinibacter salmoneus TaxID=556530 RepID=UPI000BF9BD82|nr:hypothetical protein [Serinibacter salmoneus]